MHLFNEEFSVSAPLLTKLTDHDPEKQNEVEVLNTVGFEILHDDLRCSLENLLNSRLKIQSLPPSMETLETSALTYGIPDFSGYNFLNEDSHRSLCRIIKKAIEAFEPRLHNVNVYLLDNETIEIKRALSFRIEATISVANKPHGTSFESAMDIVSRNFRFEHN